jgi:hypothetical protein
MSLVVAKGILEMTVVVGLVVSITHYLFNVSVGTFPFIFMGAMVIVLFVSMNIMATRFAFAINKKLLPFFTPTSKHQLLAGIEGKS